MTPTITIYCVICNNARLKKTIFLRCAKYIGTKCQCLGFASNSPGEGGRGGTVEVKVIEK